VSTPQPVAIPSTLGGIAPRASDGATWRPSPRLVPGALFCAFAIGAGIGVIADPAAVVLGASVALVLFTAAVFAPRTSLLIAVFVLVTHVADVAPGVAGDNAAPAIVGLLVAATFARRVIDGTPVRLPRDARWIGVYLAGLALATVAAGDRGSATDGLVDVFGYAALVVLLLMQIDSTIWMRRLVWTVVVALGLLAFLAVFQQVTHTYGSTFGGLAHIEPDAGVMRSGGPLSANYFGQMLTVGAVLAGYVALAARGRRDRFIGILVMAACLVALAFTFSRGAIVGVVVAAAVAALLRRARLAIVAGVAVGTVLVVVFVMPPEVSRRVTSLQALVAPPSERDSSLQGRASENLAALEMWRAHPIEGVGPGNFELNYLDYSAEIGLDARAEARSAHSLYLESLAETGLLGSVPFFVLLGVALWRPWRARTQLDGESSLLAEGVFVALVAYLVTALTLHAAFIRNLWIVLALALVTGQVARLEAGLGQKRS
jgi:O-antigen ligase